MAAGDRVVAFSGSDELGEMPDLIFDPRTAIWSRLPADPLSPSFARSMAWTGTKLILFDHELVPNPNAEEPSVTRAAALDLETGLWQRLPDSEILGTGPWVTIDGRLVNPTLGGADGGSNNPWGRWYPYGGVLDPGRGAWSPLPETPFVQDDETFSAGALTESGGHYSGYKGWILDTSSGIWVPIPALDPAEGFVTGRTAVAAGADLLVFGGAHWTYRSNPAQAELLNEAWIWSPRG